MNYLLLGGAGFIGTHLARRLLEAGHKVTIIDNLSTSEMPEDFSYFHQQDIRDGGPILDFFIEKSDVVYFLAASVGVQHIDKDPKGTLENNIELIQAVIPLLEKYNKKCIFASSSEVYGDGPFLEDGNLSIGNPQVLRWGYAAAKLTTEFMIAASSFPFIIARFFNIVGPGQLPDYGMVLPNFIKAIKNKEDLIVHGDGKQVRSFCHVKDAVDFLLQLEYNNSKEFPIYNIGNDQPITIKQLAEKVIELSDSSCKLSMTPYKEVFSENTKDINYRVPDLTKLRRNIMYAPKYSLDDIIKDML